MSRTFFIFLVRPNPFVILPRRRASYLTYLLLLGVLTYVCALAATDANMDARVRGLRYWTLLATAVFAIAAPHVLLPDRDLPLLQRLNCSPSGLLWHQLKKWQPIVILFIIPCLPLAFWDPEHLTENLGMKALHAMSTVLIILGTALYSFGRYVNIGPMSQAWQEGQKGDWYRTMKENTSGLFSVPEGMVPALLATQHVFLIGLLILVAAAYLGQSVALLLAVIPGAVLLVWSVVQLLRQLPHYDHAYYATNAFYSEIFRRAGGMRVGTREMIPYSAVYWSPARYKPHVWASLRQLDRKLPLGRMMAMAHGLLWVLFYLDTSMRTVSVYLLLLIVAKNGVSYVLTRPAFAPQPFQLGRQSERDWIFTRLLVNLRWTLPLLLSLLVVATLDASLLFKHALGWTALDVAVAFATALLFTYTTEHRYRQHFS